MSSSARSREQYWIVELEAYEGDDTAITLWGDREPGRLYVIVSTGKKGAYVYDRGYRTRAEAKRACPDAR